MSSLRQCLFNIGPKLLPFLVTISVYFKLFIPDNKPSIWAMYIKCAPIISLMFFVIMHRISLQNENTFSRHIIWGLIFSCGGDALLIWPQYFLHGMVSFAVAQIIYIKAFGFQNFNLSVAVPLYSLGFYVLSILLKKATDEFLIGLPLYTILLVTMAWRAAARTLPTTKKPLSWARLCACVGGLLFAASDAFIGFDRFHESLPNAQLKIMVTYYLAQLGISLSVCEDFSETSNESKTQGATSNSKAAKNNNQYK